MKVEFPELFYRDPSELGEDAFKPFKFPTREQIAKVLAKDIGFTDDDDVLARCGGLADAVLKLFYCVCGVGDTIPCPDCPTPSEQ